MDSTIVFNTFPFFSLVSNGEYLDLGQKSDRFKIVVYKELLTSNFTFISNIFRCNYFVQLFFKLEEINRHVLLVSDKYEVYPPSSGKWNGEWRLGLMVVDQSDSGLYYCVATYDEFEATAQAGFNVVVDG